MVKKKSTKLKAATGYTIPENVHCQDCAHSYDYHEKNYKGEFFMCKCPFFKVSKFLRSDICEQFKPKEDENMA